MCIFLNSGLSVCYLVEVYLEGHQNGDLWSKWKISFCKILKKEIMEEEGGKTLLSIVPFYKKVSINQLKFVLFVLIINI